MLSGLVKQRKVIQGFLTYKMSKEKIDRGFTWDEEEISLLINIWTDESIQQALDICSRKMPIFQNIAKHLEGGGFTRSHSLVTAKITQLKQKYQKMKDNNYLPGKIGETFKHLDKIEEIMGCRPITKPTHLLAWIRASHFFLAKRRIFM